MFAAAVVLSTTPTRAARETGDQRGEHAGWQRARRVAVGERGQLHAGVERGAGESGWRPVEVQ